MGCSNSKVSTPENFDERWNNKTGLCLALRFEAGEEKSLGLKCGIEKKGYHTKRGRKGDSNSPRRRLGFNVERGTGNRRNRRKTKFGRKT